MNTELRQALRILWHRPAFSLGFTLMAACAGPTDGPQQPHRLGTLSGPYPAAGLDDQPSEPFTEIARLAWRAVQAPGIWPEFVVPDRFVVCQDDGGTMLFWRGTPPAELGQGTPLLLEPDMEAVAFTFNHPTAGLNPECLDPAYSVGAWRVWALPVVDSAFSAHGRARATVATLIHEFFHDFQLASFSRTRSTGADALNPGVVPPMAVVNSHRFRRLATRERQLLIQALTTPLSTDSAIISEYLRVRCRRLRLLPLLARHGEAVEERKEGSAHLVSYEYLAAATASPYDEVRTLVLHDLVRTPDFDGAEYISNEYRRWFLYATGAAIGLLLEEHNPSWRQELQDGSTFNELLSSVVWPGRTWDPSRPLCTRGT